MTAAHRRACDCLAGLLAYPSSGYRARLDEARVTVAALNPAAAGWLSQFKRATSGLSLPQLQELYTETFDLDPRCALDLGWHVFGDTHDRGVFLAMLRQDLAAAGVEETTELPDHATHVLQLIGRVSGVRAVELGAFAGAAVDTILEALDGRRNAYEFLLRGVGETVRAVPVGSEPATGD